MDSGSVSESAAVGEGEGQRERCSEWCAELPEHAHGYAEKCTRYCHTGFPPVWTAHHYLIPVCLLRLRIVRQLLSQGSLKIRFEKLKQAGHAYPR